MSVTDQSIRDVLGVRLRRRRNDLGLSLRSVATRSGLSRSFLSLLERGRKGILMENLVVLAPALRVGPGWFFEELPAK